MIQIVGKKEGFRRCGLAHPKGAVDYPDGHWTEEQLADLRAEPMLVVTVVEDKSNGRDTTARPNASVSIELVKAATTGEYLDELAAGEERKSVLEAIVKRRAELAAAEG